MIEEGRRTCKRPERLVHYSILFAIIEDLFLQTKYTPIAGQDLTKPIPYNPSDSITKQVRSSCQKSLANLGTTYLDSYILHSPLPSLEQTLEAWQALAQLQDEGKVKLIGVSNTYNVKTLAALDKARKVQVVQNRWYEGNVWDPKVFNYCKKNGIMYQSFWTLTGSPSLLNHPAILQIATASNITAPQVVYKFAQSQGIIPLSGTENELHMKEDVAVEKLPLQGDGDEDVLEVVKAIVTGYTRG